MAWLVTASSPSWADMPTAAALAYGVMEQLAQTEVMLEGRKRSLMDEVDAISGVSGGSFTAAYYGLYGRRIFDDFETRFLKKNVQKDLIMESVSLDRWGDGVRAHYQIIVQEGKFVTK